MNGYQQAPIQLTYEQLALLQQIQRQQQAQIQAAYQQWSPQQAYLQAGNLPPSQMSNQHQTLIMNGGFPQVVRQLQPFDLDGTDNFMSPTPRPLMTTDAFVNPTDIIAQQQQPVGAIVAEQQRLVEALTTDPLEVDFTDVEPQINPFEDGEQQPQQQYGFIKDVDWTYMLLAFVIFSISLTVICRQSSRIRRTICPGTAENVKEDREEPQNSDRKIFRGMFGTQRSQQNKDKGDKKERVDKKNSLRDEENQANKDYHERLIKSSWQSSNTEIRKNQYLPTDDDETFLGQSLEFLESTVKGVVGKPNKKQQIKYEKDLYIESVGEYETLDDGYNSVDSNGSYRAQGKDNKTTWIKDSSKQRDQTGRQEGNECDYTVDGFKEEENIESPVAILSAMDLNCDDDQVNILQNDLAEQVFNGQIKKTDLDSSMLKELYKGEMPEVEEDSDESDHDQEQEKSESMEQSPTKHHYDDLNDLTTCEPEEASEQNTYLKIDDAL